MATSVGIDEKEFSDLLLACNEVATTFPEGVVFIGGIAVYMHAINNTQTRDYAEFTHDADFYISIADMSDLRDIEEVVANRRLNKHQLTKRGFEFDIYTERHSALIVPYDQVLAHSLMYDQLRVSSLEHLLVLKLEAYRDRRASSKGQKDAKDIIRIALIADGKSHKFDPQLAIAFLSEEHLSLLNQIQKGPEFLSLAKGNAKEAKSLRQKFSNLADSITQ